MTTPLRIQRMRAKGWRMPDGAIYVGRPSMWGNPFRVGQRWHQGLRYDEVKMIDQSVPGVRLIAFDPPIPLIPFPAPLTIEDVLSRYRAHILELYGLSLIREKLAGQTIVTPPVVPT